MPEIPEKLKWYQPLGLGSSAYSHLPPPWKIIADKLTGCVEVKRAPLIRISTVATALVLTVMAIAVGALFSLIEGWEGVDWLRNLPNEFFIFLFPIVLAAFLTLDAITIVTNSRHWKGRLRFRFVPQNSELFFPRENVTYQLKDCSKIVLGCVRGYDKRGWSKAEPFGIYYKIGTTGRPGSDKSHKPVTQIFILILNEHNKWQRHNLADDWASWRNKESGSKQFMKLIEKLQPLLECEVFIKDYSKDECFAQQNSTTH